MLDERYKDIRAGIKATMEAINKMPVVEDYPPNDVKANGTAWIGFFRTLPRIGMSGQQTWVHSVPFTVVAGRNFSIEQATKALEPILVNVIEQFYANQDLGITPAPDHVELVDWEQGIWQIGQLPYVGFQIRLSITERVNITIN